MPSPLRAHRIAISALFFLQGLCFGSWAARIPTVQQNFGLSHSGLGLLLLALPAGSLLSLALSGWLVTRFGSRSISALALLLYAAALLAISLSSTVPALVGSLMLFGCAGNTTNIAMNTQAVELERRYTRSIFASFHGIWSLAGFVAAAIGTWMITEGNPVRPHFTAIAAVLVAGLALLYGSLLPHTDAGAEKPPVFVLPDKPLLRLGAICFCSLICEGAMFDWSNIYFQKIVHAKGVWAGAGYTVFMTTMAAGRFVADRLSNRFGPGRTIRLNALLLVGGLLLSVAFPVLPVAIAGFLLVGLGVSSIVPLVYASAGRHSRLSPGMALAAVSGIGFLGFLAGPPVIGLLAGAFSLRVSFLFVACMGTLVFLLARGAVQNANT